MPKNNISTPTPAMLTTTQSAITWTGGKISKTKPVKGLENDRKIMKTCHDRHIQPFLGPCSHGPKFRNFSGKIAI